MSLYWKKCPHCGHTIEHGYGGNRTQYFGNPKKQCKFCLESYIDRDVIDWPNASLFRKFTYCLANGRISIIWPYIIVACLAHTKLNWEHPLLYCLPILLLQFALCVAYVKYQVKNYYGDMKKKDKKRKK